MPYSSDAQRRYFNANREELESEGVDVAEWNEKSKGKKLPEKASICRFPLSVPHTENVRMDRKQAVIKMAAFIRFLGNKIPVGTKAAQVENNLRQASKMHKLADAVQKHNDLFKAVDEVYATKSAAYRHQVVSGLVKGLSARIKQAMGGLGVSQHPSAGMMSGGAASGGMAITSPMSKTVGM